MTLAALVSLLRSLGVPAARDIHPHPTNPARPP